MKVKGKKSFKKYAQQKLLPELRVRHIRQKIKKERGTRVERRGKREQTETKTEEDEHKVPQIIINTSVDFILILV